MVSGRETERFFAGNILGQDQAEEVANDAIQLMVIATFNGLCRLIAAVAGNGLLSPEQLANIEDAMTTPLDDPNWREDSTVAGTRVVVETVLARAVNDALCVEDE